MRTASSLFFGLIALILAGRLVAQSNFLEALPDISDVQVIIHTEWMGQPPNLIEDQVTYPVVTAMLAAPHVKAVRAQTMPNDSCVFVVFEDGTVHLLGAQPRAGMPAADHGQAPNRSKSCHRPRRDRRMMGV